MLADIIILTGNQCNPCLINKIIIKIKTNEIIKACKTYPNRIKIISNQSKNRMSTNQFRTKMINLKMEYNKTSKINKMIIWDNFMMTKEILIKKKFLLMNDI